MFNYRLQPIFCAFEENSKNEMLQNEHLPSNAFRLSRNINARYNHKILAKEMQYFLPEKLSSVYF